MSAQGGSGGQDGARRMLTFGGTLGALERFGRILGEFHDGFCV
jgi:hypothetical protein